MPGHVSSTKLWPSIQHFLLLRRLSSHHDYITIIIIIPATRVPSPTLGLVHLLHSSRRSHRYLSLFRVPSELRWEDRQPEHHRHLDWWTGGPVAEESEFIRM